MNILFTNVKVNGQSVDDDGDTDVMVFTKLSMETLRDAYHQEGSITFDECYAVPDRDVQFYLYDAAYLSDDEERRAIALANEYRRLRRCAASR